MALHIEGPWFKDDAGRTRILRGVNLSGSSKVPYRPNGATHIREGFFDHRRVSFVGRPFPLEEADEHFTRLRSWGLTFLRFLVTWEAIEHAGPGIYDVEYLDYVARVVEKAHEHGFQLSIDPHQDVWSRFSGGDGAPGWTFEVAGLDVRRFHDTGAAIVHATHGDPFPCMIWFTNSTKLAAMTLFTLFFGGNDFAPETRVHGEPVQEFLQRHYIQAILQLALHLKGLSNVVGYDTMNEPDRGMIGRTFSSKGPYPKGISPTMWQAIQLGAGFPQEVDVLEFGITGVRRVGRQRVNPGGISAWLEGRQDVWRQNGVWDLDAAGRPQLLVPDYFTQREGREVNFHRDYLQPFINRFTGSIRMVDENAIIFVEGAPMETGEETGWGAGKAEKIVHAAHWYDVITLTRKNFTPWFNVDYRTSRPLIGSNRVLQAFISQLADIQEVSRSQMGDCPSLIGEFGIPLDMQSGKAYRTGDFSLQIRALDTAYQALDANLLNGTLWNYTPDNNNARGDQWNGEDLSIFSRDQMTGSGDLDDGGRALAAAVRPYARAVAGEPLRMSFDLRSKVFEFEFRHDPLASAPTELFIPHYQYPDGITVHLSDGEYAYDREGQTLSYSHTPGQYTHLIRVAPGPARS